MKSQEIVLSDKTIEIVKEWFEGDSDFLRAYIKKSEDIKETLCQTLHEWDVEQQDAINNLRDIMNIRDIFKSLIEAQKGN